MLSSKENSLLPLLSSLHLSFSIPWSHITIHLRLASSFQSVHLKCTHPHRKTKALKLCSELLEAKFCGFPKKSSWPLPKEPLWYKETRSPKENSWPPCWIPLSHSLALVTESPPWIMQSTFLNSHHWVIWPDHGMARAGDATSPVVSKACCSGSRSSKFSSFISSYKLDSYLSLQHTLSLPQGSDHQHVPPCWGHATPSFKSSAPAHLYRY